MKRLFRVYLGDGEGFNPEPFYMMARDSQRVRVVLKVRHGATVARHSCVTAYADAHPNHNPKVLA